VSEPGHPGSSFRMDCKPMNGRYLDPDRFLAEAPVVEGSWWPRWAAWLGERSGAATALPPMGAAHAGQPPFGDAPGTYVFQE